MATDMTVAKTILAQLGGNKFVAMTGAKHMTGRADALIFGLPGRSGFVKKNINMVKITLDPSDTYTMNFYRVRGLKITDVETVSDVYCDMLQETFTRVTGLDTYL